MVKRYLRTVLALLLCCAMLASNLGFAEELTELAAEVAAAELAPEAAAEEAVEPEAAPAAEEPAPEAEEAEAEPEEAPAEESAEAPEQATEPEADVAPVEGEATEPEAPVEDEIAEPEAPEQDEAAPEEEAPEEVPEEEHPVILDPALEESIEGEEFAAEDCDHHWYWDDDLGKSVCANCGADNPCEHSNRGDNCSVEPSYLWDDAPQDLGNGKHGGMGRFATWYHCLDCDSLFDVTYYDNGLTYYEEEHIWNTEENPIRCYSCDAVNTCTHPNAEDCEGILWEGEVVDKGNGTHGGMGRKGTWKWCPDCDCDFDLQFEDDGPTYYEEEHNWNTEENPIRCYTCDAVNDCDHDGTLEDYGLVEIRLNENTSRNVITPEGHEVYCDILRRWHCTNCNAEFDTWSMDEFCDGQHEWDFNPQGEMVCMYCNFENSCDHEGTTELQEWEETDWDREDGWEIRSDANGCSVWTRKCRQYYCQKCDARWGWEVVEDGIRREYQPHEWNEDNPNECNWCDYENTCNHARATKEDEEGWYDPTDDGRSFDESIGTRDAEGHHGIPAIHNFWWNCPDCGAHYMTHDEEDSVDGEHDWDEDNTCRICGYENPCDHSDFRTEEWEEPDWDRENPVIVSNETSHQVWARTVSEKVCRDCGYRFDWKIVRDGYKVTGEHSYYFDEEENVIWCGMCHYVSKCNHPDAETWDEWFEIDPNASGNVIDGDHHHVTGTLYRRMYCPACDTDYIESEENYVEDGDHEWDWSYDGHDPAISWCVICHAENTCEHLLYHICDDQYVPDPAYEGEDYLIDSDEKGHSYHAIYLTSKQCDDCGSVFDRVEHPVEENGGVITEEHQWDYEDPNHCWICNWENSCDHPDEACVTNWENLYPNEDTHVDWCTEYEHRVSNMTWEAEIHCNKCGADFHVETEDYVHEGEHEWDEDGKECWICGYKNPCDHPVGKIFPTDPWWEPFDDGTGVVDNHDGTHTGTFVQCEQTYCEQCGANFDWHIIQGPVKKTEEHQWSYDDEGKTCDFCGAVNECSHEHTTENWVDVDDIDWEHVEIVEQTPDSHVLLATCRAELTCEDCGATFQVEYEDYRIEQEHEWDGQSASPVCWKCGYVPKCTHPEEKVQYSEWWEVDEDRPNPIVSTSDEGHTAYMRKVGMYECYECGAYWGWTILVNETDKPELQEHDWDYEGGTECTICGWQNSCEHEKSEEVNVWYDTTDETKVESATADGHRVSHLTRNVEFYCPDCDRVFVVREEDVEIEGEHEWNGDDGKTCWLCDYANPCDHQGTTVKSEPWVERDDSYPNEGIISTNAKNHTMHARRVQESYCTECGLHFGWEVIEDGFSVTEPHEWSMWDEAHTCEVCGAENSCKHANATLENEWDEPYDYEDQPDSVRNHNWGQEEEHTVKGNHCQDWYCEDCDSWYRIDEENADVTVGHDWVWDTEAGASRCRICGKANECAHKNAHAEEWWDFNSDEDLISSDETGHTAWFWHSTGLWCDDCQSRVNQTEPERVQEKREHEWDEDNEGRTCWVCGWENPCDHEGTLELIEDDSWFEIDPDNKANQIDQNGHDIWGTYHAQFYCENCDAWFRQEWEDYNLVGEHSWDDEAGECWECGWKNQCKHEDFNEDSWVEPEPGTIESNAEGHSFRGVMVTEKFCNICGMGFDRTETPMNETITAPHEYTVDYDDATKCIVCDYENTCTDHVPTRGTSWTDLVRVVDRSAAGHTVLLVNSHDVICSKCGAYLGVESDEGSDREVFVEHIYDGETAEDCSECLDCGWKNPCTHAKHHTETGEAANMGACLSQTATQHVMMGYRYSYEQCDYCGATWNYQEEQGVKLTLPHQWDSVEGAYCYDCNYHNTCNHAGATKAEDTSDPIYVLDLSTSTQHAYIVQKRTFTRCGICGAEYDIEYEMSEPTFEDHDFGSGTVCSKCGFDKSKATTLTGLHFEDSDVLLGVGEKYTPVLVKEPEGSGSAITFESGDAKVFTVNERTGEITAIGEGDAELTATGDDKTASVTVMVRPASTSIHLTESELMLPVGESADLSAQLLPGGSASEIYWSSDDEGVVRFEDGKAIACGVGEAAITAAIRSGASATCYVFVFDAPSARNMNLALANDRIGVGETIEAWVDYDGACGDYEITSSRTSVATVSKKGDIYAITGVAAGTTTITAKAYNGATVSVDVTVVGAPDKLAFAYKPSKMGVGEKYTLIAQLTRKDGAECSGTITYTSNKNGVVSVDANGVLTANQAGFATITARCGTLKATAKITVKKSATSISLNQQKISLGVGESPVTLKATLAPKGAAANVTWSSDNPEVASVDFSSGKVSPVGTGVARITASINDGKIAAQCVVTVSDAPTKDTMRVEIAKQRISKGETLEPVVRFTGGAGGSYTLSSTNEKILKFDKKTGKFKAKKAGTAQIIATAWNGMSATSDIITVTPTPTGVKSVPKTMSLMVDDYFVIAPTIVPAGAETVLTVSSNNTAVATVEEWINGETGAKEYCVTAKSVGTAKITFVTANKKKATCKLTVKGFPTQITLSATELKLVFDGSSTSQYTTTEKLKGTLVPKGSAGTVEWFSDDPDVAVVDANGKVVPHGFGNTTIWAYVANSDGDWICETSCEVSVKAAPTALNTKLDPADDRASVNGKIQLRVGESLDTKISYIGSAGEVKAGSYKCSDTKIATVSKKGGKITAKKAGTATISVKMYNGVKLELQIEVI